MSKTTAHSIFIAVRSLRPLPCVSCCSGRHISRRKQKLGTVGHCSIVSRAEPSNAAKLKQIYSNITGGRLARDSSYISSVSADICSMLSQPSLSKNDLRGIAKVICLFRYPATSYYDRGFLDALSEVLLGTRNEAVLNCILPSFLSVCDTLRHYHPLLLSHAGGYILDNLRLFNTMEVDSIVHSYAKLNHYLPRLIPEVEKWVLQHPHMVYNNLFWTLAWAGMVFAEYPKELLTAILNDKYIEGMCVCVVLNVM